MLFYTIKKKYNKILMAKTIMYKQIVVVECILVSTPYHPTLLKDIEYNSYSKNNDV